MGSHCHLVWRRSERTAAVLYATWLALLALPLTQWGTECQPTRRVNRVDFELTPLYRYSLCRQPGACSTPLIIPVLNTTAHCAHFACHYSGSTLPLVAARKAALPTRVLRTSRITFRCATGLPVAHFRCRVTTGHARYVPTGVFVVGHGVHTFGTVLRNCWPGVFSWCHYLFVRRLKTWHFCSFVAVGVQRPSTSC